VGRIDHVERNPASGFARAEAQPASHPERYRHFLVLQVPVGDGLTSLPSAAATSSTELAGATNKTK
jgi:rod shape-determining protein MreC